MCKFISDLWKKLRSAQYISYNLFNGNYVDNCGKSTANTCYNRRGLPVVGVNVGSKLAWSCIYWQKPTESCCSNFVDTAAL